MDSDIHSHLYCRSLSDQKVKKIMWKLQLSKGDDDHPGVRSVNHHIGRQFWEFDPHAGTPEERSQIESMHEEFTRNRLNVKHSSDLLMRFQVIMDDWIII